jgi:hypothetical protein
MNSVLLAEAVEQAAEPRKLSGQELAAEPVVCGGRGQC